MNVAYYDDEHFDNRPIVVESTTRWFRWNGASWLAADGSELPRLNDALHGDEHVTACQQELVRQQPICGGEVRASADPVTEGYRRTFGAIAACGQEWQRQLVRRHRG